ncbi:MAG TPA: SDR family oxidoreductase [Reyranellaceae bacterium]|nr:SDR family oxidoreductase [Reyranellaceae bacterium]
MSTLAGKVAWITGGGTGIGRAGALALARLGVTVVVSGRSDKTLKETAELVKKAGGKVEIRKLDVADKKAAARTAQAIEKKHGRIDILVNSAGTNVPNRSWEALTVEAWESVVRTNLDGMFYCCLAVLPGMRKRRDGLVINISSWFGKVVLPAAGPSYTASKFGAGGMTETINAEEGRNGIRACTICPGEVATPILLKRPIVPPKDEQDRMLQEEDLGRTIAFVASMPTRVCVNEIIISPSHNRFYGSRVLETKKK